MTTLSSEASKRVFELIGEYETEKRWLDYNGGKLMECPLIVQEELFHGVGSYPAPTFAELLFIFGKITEALNKDRNWQQEQVRFLACLYSDRFYQPTEAEAMGRVEEYLMKLL